METKLSDGDIALGPTGLPVSVSGAEEIVQRAMIRLGMRRGSFALVPELGSELFLLNHRPQDLSQQAAMEAARALEGLAGCTVESVTAVRADIDRVDVNLVLSVDGEAVAVALTVAG